MVLPKNINIIATGGINASNLAAWLSAGATGAGIGSEIYKPGFDATRVAENIKTLCTTLNGCDDGSGKSGQA